MDSGGFTELQRWGRWTLSAYEYADQCQLIVDEIGNVDFIAPQDWMCEPIVIAGGRGFCGTGFSVDYHQHLTVDNLFELRSLAPDLPFIPVLQGYTLDEYLRCADLYRSNGVDLEHEPLVGLGSVCRRQAMTEAAFIVRSLAEQLNVKLHGFGFKQDGIANAWPWLASADSLAWSYNARADARHGYRGGCTRDKSCANHKHYAVDWWHRTSRRVAPLQLDFLDLMTVGKEPQ
jgi:hypothetical protein